MSLKNFMSYEDASTVLGEYADKVNELKSGLTNYQTQNDINLEVPNRKNILPMTVDGIKAANSGATWTGNTTTISGVTYTIETDDGGNVIGILANGKCTEVWHSVLYLAITDQIDSSIFLTGCPSGGNANTFAQQIYDAINDSVITRDYGDGDNNNPILSSLSEGLYVRIVVRYDYTANNLEFRPMIRLASETDPTFAPYIPSVDARLDAVESGFAGLTNKIKDTSFNVTCNECFSVEIQGSHYITDKVVHINCLVKALSVPDETDISIAILPSGMTTAIKQSSMTFPIFKANGRWGSLSSIVYGYVSTNALTTKKSEVVVDHYYYIDYIAHIT